MPDQVRHDGQASVVVAGQERRGEGRLPAAALGRSPAQRAHANLPAMTPVASQSGACPDPIHGNRSAASRRAPRVLPVPGVTGAWHVGNLLGTWHQCLLAPVPPFVHQGFARRPLRGGTR